MVDATIVRASRAAGGAINDPREIPASAVRRRRNSKNRMTMRSDTRAAASAPKSLVGHGARVVVGIYVTPGQRHESTVFKPLLRRVLLPRRPNEPYWPTKLAADKGYSYPHIRRWVKRRRIEPVIPTRKDQPRDDDFDKTSYRKRNRIERVVGHYKECRALGTRYEKLAVDYVTLWMIAMIEKMLRLGHQTASADL